ncbi:glucose 1-dehydrogenase [Rhodovibrionaceae bacterium A322]
MSETEGRAKLLLVTGGASGIGFGVAERMLREGWRVAISDLTQDKVDRAVSELREGAPAERVLGFEQNVADESRWQEVLSALTRDHGALDGLVNSAGIAINKSVVDTTLEEWRQVMAVNLDGVFLGCKHAIGAMTFGGAEGGSIVNMSSVSGLIGGHNLAAYNASKGGVRLLTKSVALHCAKEGNKIRCNSVHPTFVETPMVQAMIDGAREPEKTHERLTRQIPLRRLGQVSEIAAMVAYLLSDEAAFTTGSELVIDGGVTAT